MVVGHPGQDVDRCLVWCFFGSSELNANSRTVGSGAFLTLSCSLQFRVTSFAVRSMAPSNWGSTETVGEAPPRPSHDRRGSANSHTGLFLLVCSSKSCRSSRMASCWKAFPKDLEGEADWLYASAAPSAGHASEQELEKNPPVRIRPRVHFIRRVTPGAGGGAGKQRRVEFQHRLMIKSHLT